jgi:hypothetical protein
LIFSDFEISFSATCASNPKIPKSHNQKLSIIFTRIKILFVIRTLLAHQWKSFWRSRNAGKSLALQIFIAFISIYLLVMAIALGFFLQKLLIKTFPGQDVISIFCSFILYYFLFDMLSRFMLQDLPTLTIQPYLVQNIQRRQLIRFLNVRSMVNVINFLPLLLFVPFTLMAIAPKYGGMAAFTFIISILALTFFNHFIILYIKRKSIVNSWWFVIFFGMIGSLAAADYFHFFSLRNASAFIFTRMLASPLICVLPLAMAVFAFVNNYRFLFKNLYLEDIVTKNSKKEGVEYTFLNRFGAIGELMGLDIKLILRNKRPRSVAVITLLFLFYGFIFYKQQYLHNGKWGLLLFGAVFISGMFIINYGQFLFAWQSAHFDGMMASNLGVKTYIKSKFVFFTAVCTVELLLISFYGLMGWQLLIVQLAAYFYNVGIHTVISVYFATRSYKAIDIGRAATFNYQGMGAEKWIYTLVVILVPIVIYAPIAFFINEWTGIIAIGVLGLVSFLLQDWWIDILTKEFFKRKYKILDGFREK